MDKFILIFGVWILACVVFFTPAVLYTKFGIFKRWYHDVLGWHEPKEDADQTFDGVSVHCVCKHCGKEIMQDSQGNWF